MGAWLDLDDAVYNHHVAKRQLQELRAENEKYRLEMRENCKLRARIAELEAELDAERRRRWDGNRVASDEQRAEVLAIKAERDRLREAVEFIAEAHDTGRHDGLPEPCPAHDAETMFAVARAALEGKG